MFIEDVFSTYLYTGNGSTQTITNGIDLAGKGGLVWAKTRDFSSNHALFDTVRGGSSLLQSNLTNAAYTGSTYINPFNSNGFTWAFGDNQINGSSRNYVSWTFREQPKFFDVVTYTGASGNAVQNIAHNLGSLPGTIIVKCIDAGPYDWIVYHRSLGATKYINLNSTAAAGTTINYWNNTEPTATQFTVGGSGGVNGAGQTYVAYLFAHNAGGFPVSGGGSTNGISCGSFTTDGSGNASVNLGYEPQFWLYKPNLAARYWTIYDIMRGWSQTEIRNLNPNVTDAEGGGAATAFYPTATGFDCVGGNLDASTEHIYIAIRRGPMKTPTVGTSVFAPLARTGSGTNPTVVTTGTNPDLLMSFPRTANPSAYGTVFFDKLRGVSQILQSANTNVEATTSGTFCLQGFLNTGFQTGADFVQGYLNYSGATYAQYAMTRAPGFFDEVCDTGTGIAGTVTHGLGIAPELIIRKNRTGVARNWTVACTYLPSGFSNYLFLSSDTNVGTDSTYWNATAPTTSVFSVGTNITNTVSVNYVTYLFATCAGVSKVGSYTGNGSSQTINCGFTAGSRFVMIKRVDLPGDWYVWDSARGIVAGNDPHLSLNTTAAEVTTDDSVDTDNTGFIVNQLSATDVNVTSATYIFLAIA